jgi:hypothetical protein
MAGTCNIDEEPRVLTKRNEIPTHTTTWTNKKTGFAMVTERWEVA